MSDKHVSDAVQNKLCYDKKMDQSGFEKITKLLVRLRDPKGGCPWDKAQSHETLMTYLLEEVHEVRDALSEHGENSKEFIEELGDVLFQVTFHAQLLSERGLTNLNKIASDLNDKMVARHPHVFDPKHDGFSDAEAVNKAWEGLKSNANKTKASTKLKNIPANLPALQRSYRLGEKAASLGFSWDEPDQAFKKITEELQELVESESKESRQEELGDLLFAISQWARMTGLDPEWALTKANSKFMNRFEKMESFMSKDESFKEMTLAQKLDLWKSAKS